MNKKPIVSISIPTFNSGPFLERCLAAINSQDYPYIEVILVDGGSRDNTLTLAKKLGVKKIITDKHSLLHARYEGVKVSKGEFVLLLDSDQILNRHAISQGVAMLEKNDMLVLEESVYSDKTFIEKLFKMDRELIHKILDYSPLTGVVLPRFYRKSIIDKAFDNIPEDILKGVGGQDHAIIYYEAWQLSTNVGLIQNAVRHIEPSTLAQMWKKFYRWGATSVSAHQDKYSVLLAKKERFRGGWFKKGLFKQSLASFLLLIIKGVPYKLGYIIQKIKSV